MLGQVGAEVALVVGLERAKLGSAKVCVEPGLQNGDLVLEPQAAVDFGLAGSELTQVDSVNNMYHHATKVRSAFGQCQTVYRSTLEIMLAAAPFLNQV